MVVHSALYTGTVRHRRFTPVEHAFKYSMSMLYLDLDEVDALITTTRFWSNRRFAPGWFRRRDFLGNPDTPLVEAVRNLVENATGDRPYAVRLLTNARYFGFLMNPISCYYCFAEDGETLLAVVAEVTNTPWNRRHPYVLKIDPQAGEQTIRFEKKMHVSPFNPLDMTYTWRGRTPGERIGIHLDTAKDGTRVFDAALSLQRQPLSAAALDRFLLRYPLMTLKIFAAIYREAFRLLIKRAPFYTNPHSGTEPKETTG